MRRIPASNFETDTEVEGLVLPAEWDALGKPISYKICSPGEASYTVVNSPGGRSLKSYLRQYIRVLGKVKVTSDGELTLWVDRIFRNE